MMDAERFERLIDAYGARPERWPADERAAAEALAATPAGVALAARAASLDHALDQWRPEPASAALRERIVAAAPRPRPTRRPRLWWAGAGLAAACAMGAVIGASVYRAAGDPVETLASSSDSLTIFGSTVDLGANL